MTPPADSKLHNPWLALLLLPFIGVVSVAAYGHVDTRAWGIPYFFQVLWMLLSAAMVVVYIKAEPRRAAIRTRRSPKPRA
jgi:hypothetical protein